MAPPTHTPIARLGDNDFSNDEQITLLRDKLIAEREYEPFPAFLTFFAFVANDGVPVVLHSPLAFVFFQTEQLLFAQMVELLAMDIGTYASEHPGTEFPKKLRIILPINNSDAQKWTPVTNAHGSGSHWTGLVLELEDLQEKEGQYSYKKVTATYMDSMSGAEEVPPVITSSLRKCFSGAKISTVYQPVPSQGPTNFCGDATTVNTVDLAFEGRINEHQNLASVRKRLQQWIGEHNTQPAFDGTPKPAEEAKPAEKPKLVEEPKPASSTKPIFSIPSRVSASDQHPLADGIHVEEELPRSQDTPLPSTEEVHHFLDDAQRKVINDQIKLLQIELGKNSSGLKREKLAGLQALLDLDSKGEFTNLQGVTVSFPGSQPSLKESINLVKKNFPNFTQGHSYISLKHSVFFGSRTQGVINDLFKLENEKLAPTVNLGKWCK